MDGSPGDMKKMKRMERWPVRRNGVERCGDVGREVRGEGRRGEGGGGGMGRPRTRLVINGVSRWHGASAPNCRENPFVWRGRGGEERGRRGGGGGGVRRGREDRKRGGEKGRERGERGRKRGEEGGVGGEGG